MQICPFAALSILSQLEGRFSRDYVSLAEKRATPKTSRPSNKRPDSRLVPPPSNSESDR